MGAIRLHMEGTVARVLFRRNPSRVRVPQEKHRSGCNTMMNLRCLRHWWKMAKRCNRQREHVSLFLVDRALMPAQAIILANRIKEGPDYVVKTDEELDDAATDAAAPARRPAARTRGHGRGRAGGGGRVVLDTCSEGAERPRGRGGRGGRGPKRARAIGADGGRNEAPSAERNVDGADG